MGLLGEIASAILVLSSLVFITLFGRIPALRKTPVGFIYRVIWIHIPKHFQKLDRLLCRGSLFGCVGKTGHYLMNENHPLVLIFFIVLLAVSEAVFIPSAWPRLCPTHRIATPIVVILPYVFLYLSATSSSTITARNHHKYSREYPHDHTIFHPGRVCYTCQHTKPARSKHCSLCKACVARHDHHCVWLRTCVGRNNYKYFLALLLSTSTLLVYGTYLGYSLVNERLQKVVSPLSPNPAITLHWSKGLSWKIWFEFWTLAIADDIRVGAVFLLAGLTAPLAAAMFLYHVYLIWSGMTTNESSKWGEWRDDITDGVAYIAKASEVHPQPRTEDEPLIPWPRKSDQTLIYTDGKPPKVGYVFTDNLDTITQPLEENAPIDLRWAQVQNIREIDNLYDLGFWENLRDSLR